MTEERIDVVSTEPYGTATQTRRISWGAIFGGLFVTTAAMLWLGLLGTAIGLSVETARNDGQTAARTWLTAAGIWTFISALISLFLGGYVAARMSGIPRASDGTWHGIVQWAFAVVVSVWVLSWGLQTAIGTAMEAAGVGIAAGASDRSGVVAGVADAQVDRLVGDLAIRNLGAEDRRTLASRLVAGNYDAAADLLAERSNGAVTRERAHARINEIMTDARNRASEFGRRAADYGASAGWLAVATMFFGLCASALGGAAGAPGRTWRGRREHVETTTTTTGTTPTVGRPVSA